MGALVWWLHEASAALWPVRGIFGQITQLGMLIAIGGASYLALCRLFGVHEVGYVLQLLRRGRR